MSPTREDYVRVKRLNQTFFIHTSPSDNFAYIKSEICGALGESSETSVEKMRLYIAPPKNIVVDKSKDNSGGDKDEKSIVPIPDTARLSDHDVKNDAVLYVTFATGDGADDWEEIDIAKP